MNLQDSAPSDARNRAYDALKGLAMVGVLLQHTDLPLDNYFGLLCVLQAVPILVIISVRNNAISLTRNSSLRRFFVTRLRRLGKPFALAWVCSLVLGLLFADVDFGPLTLLGVLPMSGPGNYFITIVIQFVVLFPFIWRAFLRNPTATSAVLLGIGLAFECIAPHVALFEGQYPYLYDACLLRYCGELVVGLWLVSRSDVMHPRANRFLEFYAALGFGYLILLELTDSLPFEFGLGFGRSANVITAGYALFVVVALRQIVQPWISFRPLGLVVLIGRASFHIFLTQIMWFALVNSDDFASRFIAVLANCAMGSAWYLIDEAVAKKRSRTRSPIVTVA